MRAIARVYPDLILVPWMNAVMAFTAAGLMCCAASHAQTTQPAASGAIPPALPSLVEAPTIEQKTLERMLKDESWPRRAIAAMRLERFACLASAGQLVKLLEDNAWQVRAFALRSLARRGVPAQENWFAKENEPRVLRSAMRFRYRIASERLQRGVRMLSRSSDLEDKMLAAELGAASGDDELKQLALETLKLVILRMDRVQAGALSPRLTDLTGARKMYRPYDWQHWLMKTGRKLELREGWFLNDASQSIKLSRLAQLDAEPFCGLEQYMSALGERQLDLAILLDCTASMSGEIAAAQGGIDDMMVFVGDMVASLRVGLVAYRDKKDEFQTKSWDFDGNIDHVRQRLWQLSADGGGDAPEAVYPALKLALTQLHWRPESTKVLVIVGDAPPHVGYGGQCIDLAQRGRDQFKLITHVIQAKGKDVKHFPEIAKAGGGRCVSLEDDDLLMAEITGLTLGDRYQDEFREFFQAYLDLCR